MKPGCLFTTLPFFVTLNGSNKLRVFVQTIFSQTIAFKLFAPRVGNITRKYLTKLTLLASEQVLKIILGAGDIGDNFTIMTLGHFGRPQIGEGV